MEYSQHQERRIRFFFNVAILGKAVVSAIELVSGLILLLLPLSTLSHFVLQIFREELIEDPTDFFAIHAIRAVAETTPFAKSFLAFYLLIRGVVKLGLVFALVRRKLSAYPISIAVMLALMAYQAYLVATTGSQMQAFLVLLDVFIVWAIWREYRLLRA